MKVVQTEIKPFVNNPLYVEFREQPFLSSINNTQAFFHKHPELQLTFILEGFGKRIIGNKVSPFEPGDMVFIGSNVPHIWLSDPVFYEKESMLVSRVITVYIDSKIFEQMFNTIKELESIKEMISQASKGINIYGETRNIIAEKLIALCSKTGFEKVDSLLQIMNLISISQEKNFIINKNLDLPKGQHCDRLMYILNYMQNNLHEQITLNDVADLACMTTQSFCRYFKNAINKTFSEYLVELRINHACNLLIELDKPISDIAYLCGFVSHSHFCKLFKSHTGQSPHRYRSGIPRKAS